MRPSQSFSSAWGWLISLLGMPGTCSLRHRHGGYRLVSLAEGTSALALVHVNKPASVHASGHTRVFMPRLNHHHHPHGSTRLHSFVKSHVGLEVVAMECHGEHDGSARRRRQRRLRHWLRHERMTVAAELAAALHHSRDAGRVTHDGPRAQKTVSSGGMRPAPLSDAAGPQVAAATVGYVAAGAPLLVVASLSGCDGVDATTVSFLLPPVHSVLLSCVGLWGVRGVRRFSSGRGPSAFLNFFPTLKTQHRGGPSSNGATPVSPPTTALFLSRRGALNSSSIWSISALGRISLPNSCQGGFRWVLMFWSVHSSTSCLHEDPPSRSSLSGHPESVRHLVGRGSFGSTPICGCERVRDVATSVPLSQCLSVSSPSWSITLHPMVRLWGRPSVDTQASDVRLLAPGARFSSHHRFSDDLVDCERDFTGPATL